MAEALLYPHASWRPLGGQIEARMRAHDLLVCHTMVGYLTSTDPYFRIWNGVGFTGTESHYGVGGIWGPDLGGGLDGAVWQWQDRAFEADAGLEGTWRSISIETADNAPANPADLQPWTARQFEAIAQILAWESSVAAHAACPTTWTCHRLGIPLVLVPDSRAGHRGIAYHRMGVDPYRVDGGEHWSTSYGKVCPGVQRIAQIPGVIARARQIVADGIGQPPAPPPTEGDEDDMSTEMRVSPGDGPQALAVENCDRITIACTEDTSAVVTAWNAQHDAYKPSAWAPYYDENNRLGFTTGIGHVGSSPLAAGTRRVTITDVQGGTLHVRVYKTPVA